jgi:hypothetical protein
MRRRRQGVEQLYVIADREVTPQPGDPEVIFRADELGPLNLQPRPRQASGRRLGRNAKLADGGHCLRGAFPPLRILLCLCQPLLYAACAGERPAVRGGLLVGCVSHPGPQFGLDAVIMRGARHVRVQPAAAAGLQLRGGGGQQPGGALRVILLPRHGGQRLEVVGGR